MTTLYRPPGKPVEVFGFIDNLFHKLDGESKEYITIGDMNCDPLKPSKQCAKHIKRIYNKHNVTQLIKEPTRTTDDTKKLIDHISTNKPTCISESGVIQGGISDHDVTYAIRRAKLPKSKKQSKNITVRKCNKFDVEAFIKNLKSKNFDQIKTFNRYSTTARGISSDIWHEAFRLVPYHFCSSSWSGIFVLLNTKLTILSGV